MSKKDQIVSILQELRSISTAINTVSLTSHIDEECRKIEKNEFYLAVVGQFKRGKTSFINALLGDDLLPVGIVPVTSVITFVRCGDRTKIEVVFSSGRRQPIDTADLPRFVTEKGNPNNAKEVRSVEITHASEFLRGGIVLVDTPGIGSISPNNAQTTQEFLPHIDAAILILSADPPITQAEREFVDKIRAHVDRIFFVLNKIDTISESDLSEALEYAREAIRETTHISAKIYPASALVALEAKRNANSTHHHRRNLQTIEHAIQTYLNQEKWQLLLLNSVNRIQRFARELKFSLQLIVKATETPLIDLQTKIETFGRYLETLQRDRDMTFIVEGELDSLRRWISEELQLFQRAETARLQQQVTRRISSDKDMPGRELLKSVEVDVMDQLITDFEEWRVSHQREIMSRFNNILNRAVRRMNVIIEKMVQYSGNLFDVSVEPLPELKAPLPKLEFPYKIKDDPTFIEIDTRKLFSRLLPPAISRQIITRRMKEKVSEKVMVNCGRLLADYVTELGEQSRRLQYNIEEKTEAAVADIRHILSSAAERKEKDNSAVMARVTQLRQQVRFLDELLAHRSNIEAPYDGPMVTR